MKNTWIKTNNAFQNPHSHWQHPIGILIHKITVPPMTRGWKASQSSNSPGASGTSSGRLRSKCDYWEPIMTDTFNLIIRRCSHIHSRLLPPNEAWEIGDLMSFESRRTVASFTKSSGRVSVADQRRNGLSKRRTSNSYGFKKTPVKKRSVFPSAAFSPRRSAEHSSPASAESTAATHTQKHSARIQKTLRLQITYRNSARSWRAHALRRFGFPPL